MIVADTALSKLLLNERDAARMLSISPRKLWSIRSAGEIAHIQLGRMVRYAVEDLQSLIDHHRQLPRAITTQYYPPRQAIFILAACPLTFHSANSFDASFATARKLATASVKKRASEKQRSASLFTAREGCRLSRWTSWQHF